jgi:hypothetical protein
LTLFSYSWGKTGASRFSFKSLQIFIIALPDLANWSLHYHRFRFLSNRPVVQIGGMKSAIDSLTIISFTHWFHVQSRQSTLCITVHFAR